MRHQTSHTTHFCVLKSHKIEKMLKQMQKMNLKLSSFRYPNHFISSVLHPSQDGQLLMKRVIFYFVHTNKFALIVKLYS